MYIYSIVLIVAMVTGTVWGCNCTFPYKPTSCRDIARRCPDVQSGIYTLADEDVYCNMDSPCGGAGWTRIADVNMGRSTQQCPLGLTLVDEQDVRLCGRNNDGAGCSATFFSTRSIRYLEVYGLVIG